MQNLKSKSKSKSILPLMIMLAGAIIGISYAMFYDSANKSHCFLRASVLQIALVLLIIGLFEFMWKSYVKLFFNCVLALVILFGTQFGMLFIDSFQIDTEVFEGQAYAICSSTTLRLWESTVFSLLTLAFLNGLRVVIHQEKQKRRTLLALHKHQKKNHESESESEDANVHVIKMSDNVEHEHHDEEHIDSTIILLICLSQRLRAAITGFLSVAKMFILVSFTPCGERSQHLCCFPPLP
jgi:hypothetical protein